LAQLLDHWAPRGLRGVVGVGSAAEYGTRGGRLHESDAPLGPLSAYGWGKLSAGQLLEAWCQNQCPGQNQSVAATWLRPFVVYGPGQPAGMALGYVVDQVLQGKPALVTDGLQRRDFVHVEDVAEALVQALVRQPRGFQPINIASGTGVPVREVIARLSAMLGTDSLVRFGALPRRAAEPEEQFADTSAAETLLGWRAQIDWRSGIDRWASTLLSARRRRA
jgi:nucleoside-diphosphate-sugar epimerase